MMQRKIDQLQRIERLRKQLHDLTTWRLSMVAQVREKLVADHEGMMQALGEGIMAYGAPSAAATRRVRRLERELSIAKLIEKDLEKRALEDGRLAKLAQGSLEAARAEFRDKMERKSLEELIESSLADGSAPRKG